MHRESGKGSKRILQEPGAQECEESQQVCSETNRYNTQGNFQAWELVTQFWYSSIHIQAPAVMTGELLQEAVLDGPGVNWAFS